MDKALAIVAACVLYGITQAPYLTPAALRRARAAGPKLDPLAITKHHLAQMAIALGLIAALQRHGWSEWGFNLHDAGTSIRTAIVISLIYGALSFALHLTSPPTDLPWDPTRRRTIGVFAFEWLLPGPSEEIVFRGLLQTFLAHTWGGTVRLVGLDIPTAGIVAALLFCAAHLYPKPNVAQLVTAFAAGIVYAVMLGNTGSLLGPVLTHNAGDGLVVVAMWIGYRRQHRRHPHE